MKKLLLLIIPLVVGCVYDSDYTHDPIVVTEVATCKKKCGLKYTVATSDYHLNFHTNDLFMVGDTLKITIK